MHALILLLGPDQPSTNSRRENAVVPKLEAEGIVYLHNISIPLLFLVFYFKLSQINLQIKHCQNF